MTQDDIYADERALLRGLRVAALLTLGLTLAGGVVATAIWSVLCGF